MNKKIIFFIPNIDDGGIEKNLILLSNYFIDKNYKIEIVYTRISKKIKKKLNSKLLLKKTIKYINFNFLNARINNSINCFLFFLVKIKTDTNSVLFSMQDHPFSILLSKFKKIPCMIRIANHPLGSLRFFNNYFKFLLKITIKIFFYNFATVIVCNSKESSKYFKNLLFIKKKKVYTIYNPIFINKNQRKYKRDRYELVTIGRLEKQKNLVGLIKAFKMVSEKNPKVRLTIVGKGSEKSSLKELVNNLKINSFVKFKNFSNPKKFYEQKGVFILNSFFEGLPNVLIEALSYKIPIISSNCQSGPKEILKNGKFGYLININDEIDLSKKIEHVISKYSEALARAEKGFKSLDRFSITKQCEKYSKIITSL